MFWQRLVNIKAPLELPLIQNYKQFSTKILTGKEENVSDLDIPEDLTSSNMAYFKFVPITSADVEHSFSLYKNILAPNRRSFKFENLKKPMIVQCNNYIKSKKNHLF